MTPIYQQQYDRRIAWHGSDIKSKDELAFDLSRDQVKALQDILIRVKSKPRDEIALDDCRHPLLDGFFEQVMTEVQRGRGFVLLRGVPVTEHRLEDIEKIYWAIGTHLGIANSQTSLGAKMIPIQEEVLPGGVQTARGTKSRQELALHTDLGELFTLLCVRQARSGGETQFSSALAIHNELLKRYPEVLPILYRGFPYHRRGEQPDGQPAITPHDVPVFSNVDGYVSCNIVFGSIMAALHVLERKITQEELDALGIFEEIATELQYEMRFEPGEISIVNNFTVTHSRSEYVDWEQPEKRRLLYRLWLDPRRDARPVVPEIYVYQNVNGRGGIDLVPGRSAQIARNEYYAVPPEVLDAIKAGQSKRGRAGHRTAVGG